MSVIGTGNQAKYFYAQSLKLPVLDANGDLASLQLDAGYIPSFEQWYTTPDYPGASLSTESAYGASSLERIQLAQLALLFKQQVINDFCNRDHTEQVNAGTYGWTQPVNFAFA